MVSPAESVGVPLALPPANVADALAEFRDHKRLSVKQRRRWWELLVNWEQKNSYAVFDEEGNHTLQVKEEGNGFVNLLKRLFLRTARPFRATVYDNPIPKPLILLDRPFRFFFHRLAVSAADGTPLGSIEWRFAFFRRIYAILDANGVEVATLFGPFFRPWTFEIRVNGEPRGLLQKRWGGLVSELLTDADNFVLDVERVTDPKVRLLAFAATVLIDVVHFERSKHN